MSSSAFYGIELGKRSLQQFRTSMDVAGHNITNMNTEGYSRQRVVTRTMTPLENPALNRALRTGQIGQGSQITSIERIRDEFVDSKIYIEGSNKSYWNTRSNYLGQIEALQHEPSALNLRTDLDAMWSTLQEVANNPTEIATRNVLVQRTATVTGTINHMYTQMSHLRDNTNTLVEIKVNRVNELAGFIADLNKQILQVEALGDNPNDYYDQRDVYVEELSTITDIDIRSLDPDETIVYIGGRHLIQGDRVSPLMVERNNENTGYYDVRWAVDGVQTKFSDGELKALIEVRDVDLVSAMNDLNALSINLMDSINSIHRVGFGLNDETGIDFFGEIPITTNVNGDYDLNQDGVNDSTLLFKVSGTNELEEDGLIGTSGTLTFGNWVRDGQNVTVNYSSQMKVKDLVQRINSSEANVSAFIDHENKLVLKARTYEDYKAPNFMIAHIEDSGEFLVGISGLLVESGADGAYSAQNANAADTLRGGGSSYTVTPQANVASWMALNDTIKRDVSFIAAAGGIDTSGNTIADMSKGRGDGSNALAMADLRYKSVMVDNNSTFNDFYTASISKVGSATETANNELQKQEVLLEFFHSMRQSISGVSLDEELAQMMVYQHGYNASARIVTVMDQLLDVVINRMGV